MADKIKEPLGCAGCLILAALIFVVGYGLYLLWMVFVGPQSLGGFIISAVLLAAFIGGLKFFAMK
jgi:hypothetical protein